VSIARHAKKTGGRDVHTVLGGFHLSGASADRIRDISAQLKGEHVRVVVPCHCSGELARSLFQESYGQNCLAAGVGWQHTLEKPQ